MSVWQKVTVPLLLQLGVHQLGQALTLLLQQFAELLYSFPCHCAALPVRLLYFCSSRAMVSFTAR